MRRYEPERELVRLRNAEITAVDATARAVSLVDLSGDVVDDVPYLASVTPAVGLGVTVLVSPFSLLVIGATAPSSAPRVRTGTTLGSRVPSQGIASVEQRGSAVGPLASISLVATAGSSFPTSTGVTGSFSPYVGFFELLPAWRPAVTLPVVASDGNVVYFGQVLASNGLVRLTACNRLDYSTPEGATLALTATYTLATPVP